MEHASNHLEGSGHTLLFGRRRARQAPGFTSDAEYLQLAAGWSLSSGPWSATRQANVIVSAQSSQSPTWVGIGVRQRNLNARTPIGEAFASTKLAFVVLQGSGGIEPWQIRPACSLDQAITQANRLTQANHPPFSRARFESAVLARKAYEER
jgi:hypothetical protein